MFETERLILRPFTDADTNAIAAMRADAGFMRFIKPPESRRQAVAWMRMVSRYWDTDGFGFWAVILKETGATIGWSGTWNLQETREPEIGFAVAPPFWGKGFATESARVALDYSFNQRCAQKTVAVAMPDNLASRRVMEKLGMRLQEQRYFGSYGLELVYYAINQNDYARNRTLDYSQIYPR
jgi:RimJ/RimL family protein N-acetyltransferase